MKAMILAAGLGTRLKPLTDKKPKALIRINDRPLLFYIIYKLKHAGVNRIIINVYHHAEQIISYLKKNDNFGISIEISHEETLLDTGGGLKRARFFFEDNDPFILHNVDVISSVNLQQMLNHHILQKNLVTLAVKKRRTSRYLLFNKEEKLVGWRSVTDKKTKLYSAAQEKVEELSFLGIHIISPLIFEYLPVEDTFSIIKGYLNLCSEENLRIGAYRCDREDWFDLGNKENIPPASDYLLSLPEDQW